MIYVNGMRPGRLRALPPWLVTSWKVAKMFRQLKADPGSGFLGLRKGAAMQY